MFAAAALMWLWLVALSIILIRWQDWDVVWTVALAVIQLLAVVYYGLHFITHDSALIPFPVVGLTIRPHLLGVYLLVFFYTIVRLRVKRAFRLSQNGA